MIVSRIISAYRKLQLDEEQEKKDMRQYCGYGGPSHLL
jgi:hypothetical protein